MRAATRCTPNDSRTTRAAITFELSPLLTAANASAFSIPASISTSRSKPIPVTLLPRKPGRSLRNASTSWSMTATEWPCSSRMCAMVDPTRPHPMITMCTIVPPAAAVRANVMPTWHLELAPDATPAARAADRSGSMVVVRSREAVPVVVGDVLDLAVGEVVHGGWCVARPATSGPPDLSPGTVPQAADEAASGRQADAGGMVVFVRHALPGERVRAVVTQTTAKFARADAVEIVRAAPDRVPAPCPYAKP